MSNTDKAVILRVEDEVIKATEAEVTTHDHGTFTVVGLEQGRFTAQAFRGSSGQHRNVHLHGAVSTSVKNGEFGPRFVVEHADGTQTSIYIYNA